MLKFIIYISVIYTLLFLMSSCVTFRKSDTFQIKKFNKEGIELKTVSIFINNRNIHYAVVGNDSLPTVLFIHGSPGAWIEFEHFLKSKNLINKFRMISIDRPGFGYSDFGKVMHLQSQANLIGEVIKKIQNNKPLYLVGHSYGGPLVALLTADYPTLINKTIILAGALDPSLESKEKWRPLFIKSPFKYIMPGAFRPSNEELWFLKIDLIELKTKLVNIKSPVYVLHAKNDMLVNNKNTNYIKTYFTSSDVKIISFENGNHFIHFNKKKQIESLLISFLKE